MSMRLSATLLVFVLFALLTYRIVHGGSGARLTRAINAHRSPAAPNVQLSVIWPQAETWPQRLRCFPCQREAALLASAAEARRGRIVSSAWTSTI
jgi:hypothetical protein